jgi:hypothetical protein
MEARADTEAHHAVVAFYEPIARRSTIRVNVVQSVSVAAWSARSIPR